MNLVDLLVTIVLLVILVTAVLSAVTWAAHRLSRAREPGREVQQERGLHYFVAFEPPTRVPTESSDPPTPPI